MFDSSTFDGNISSGDADCGCTTRSDGVAIWADDSVKLTILGSDFFNNVSSRRNFYAARDLAIILGAWTP